MEKVETLDDGLELAFAAVALIPFRDPEVVEVLARRAEEARLDRHTRWHLLASMPLVMGIGDSFPPPGDIDPAVLRQIVSAQRSIASCCLERGSLGAALAEILLEVFEKAKRDPTAPGAGLLLWHVSAYIAGSLDLASRDVLEPLWSPEYGGAYYNLTESLCLAAARDFNAELRGTDRSESADLEKAVVERQMAWWTSYLDEHPDGDWRPATLASLREAGYAVDEDLRSGQSSRELVRALEASGFEGNFQAHGAARLLNDLYGTCFDLQMIFANAKFALSLLAVPQHDLEKMRRRLASYWRERLL